MTEKVLSRVPADLYDALETSVMAFGGIGGGQAWRGKNEEIPCCMIGHLHSIVGNSLEDMSHMPDYWCVRKMLDGLPAFPDGRLISVNDSAIKTINQRKGNRNSYALVTWKEYCDELGLVKGK